MVSVSKDKIQVVLNYIKIQLTPTYVRYSTLVHLLAHPHSARSHPHPQKKIQKNSAVCEPGLK